MMEIAESRDGMMESQITKWRAIAVFDIDGVVRDVGGSYRRALADTVGEYTQGAFRPSPEEIDALKSEGLWNNDWEASQEFVYRFFEGQGKSRETLGLEYEKLVAFFQSRYRGTDPENWNGYICQEPLLMHQAYLQQLTAGGIGWGFFSGATRGSATYVLQKRIGLKEPTLVAMEDAPGKPDPTGLFLTLERMGASHEPVIYVGDTVADMYTVERARALRSDRTWIGVGVLPPHVQETETRKQEYAETLKQAGAKIVLENVQELTPEQIEPLI
jgi:HAD superfamily phosphatase